MFVLAAYLPVLLARYGFSDDYLLLYDAQQDPADQAQLNLSNGRPIAVVLHHVGFWLAGDLGSLRWIRLFSVIGVALVGLIVMRLSEDSGRRPVVSLALGLCVVALPSMQVTTAWATMFTAVVAAPLALVAAVMAERGRVWLPACALTVAVLTYQPAAMLFWLPVAIATTGPRPWPWSRDRVSRHLVPFGIASGMALVVWLVAPSPRRSEGRFEIVHDPLAEAGWFLLQVLPRAVAWEPARVKPMISAALILGLVVGLVLAERRASRVGALLLLAVAAYAPSLVVADDWPTARSMIALTPVLVVLFFRAVEGYASVLPPKVTRAGPALAVSIGLLLLLSASWSTKIYFADPLSEELRRVSAVVAEVDPGTDARVAGAAFFHTLAPAKSLDEFGIMSSRQLWVPVPMVRLIRYEQTGSWAGHVRLTDDRGPGVIDLDRAITSGAR